MGAGRLRKRLSRNARGQLIDRRIQPPGKIARAKTRLHGLVDDARRRQVWNCPFQGLRHLNAHLPIVLCYHDEHAIAHLVPSDFPGVANAIRKGGDVFGRRARDHEHHQLRSLLLLNLGQTLLHGAPLGCIERAGLVDHVGRQCGNCKQRLSPTLNAKNSYQQYSYNPPPNKR